MIAYHFNNCIAIKHTNFLTNEISTVKMGKYYKEWVYLFNKIKKKGRKRSNVFL